VTLCLCVLMWLPKMTFCLNDSILVCNEMKEKKMSLGGTSFQRCCTLLEMAKSKTKSCVSEDMWIWVTFCGRLQTVSRVDQDFDIRRVQTAAEKFIPVYRPRGRPPPQQSQRKVSRLFFLNNQPDALFIQIYSVIKLYMFRASSLPIIRSFPLYIRHW